jgi:hypothetical protein
VVKLCPRRASRFAAHAASANVHNDDSEDNTFSRFWCIKGAQSAETHQFENSPAGTLHNDA